jgi:hypothetical protein
MSLTERRSSWLTVQCDDRAVVELELNHLGDGSHRRRRVEVQALLTGKKGDATVELACVHIGDAEMLRQGFGQRRRAGCCSAVNGNDDWVHERGLSAGSCRVLFAILQLTM